MIGIIAIILAAILGYPGKVDMKLPPEQCDAGLWQHVYEKDRLRVMEKCTAVEGRVVSLHQSADGDLHIGLDPKDKSVLNLVNIVYGRGELVVEVICEYPPLREAAKAACTGLRPQITIPEIGDHIRVTGSYVRDHELGWNEIHPVTRIEILR